MSLIPLLRALLFVVAMQPLQQPPPPKLSEVTVEIAKPSPPQPKESAADEKPPVVTMHKTTINGATISYSATAGLMPIRNHDGETEGHIFYMAYTQTDAPKSRPLLFAFNGGPGSASLWLHLGTIGPKRVKMLDDGNLPPPPYELVENESSWLDKADLVFIDPVGTGYSRPTKPEYGKKFWSVQGDVDSVGEFIRMYLTRNHRWGSPLFVAGESYGTLRAAKLSSYLLDHGIALSGVALISTILTFGGREDSHYPQLLPTFAATAWFHHKLPGVSAGDFPKLLAEVENWAETAYPAILAKGDALTPAERAEALNRLARYTGLEKRYLDSANLRVNSGQFMAEILRDRKRIVGRYDSRMIGMPADNTETYPEYDASDAAVTPPFTTLFNQYIHGELNYQTDERYYVLGEGLTAPWDWGFGGPGGVDVTRELRSALVQNPYMKLFVAAGHYDFATPFYAAKYTIDHLILEPQVRKNITFSEYEAGHMMYIDTPSRHKLKTDIAAWMDGALSGGSTAAK